MRAFTEIGDLIKITALYTAYIGEFAPGYYFKGECHDFWELGIVLSGCFGVANGSDVFILQKGQAIIHEPMKLHKLWVEGDRPARLAMFSFSAENMPDCSMKTFNVEDTGLVENTYELIKSSFEMDDISVVAVKPGRELLSSVSVKQLELICLKTALCRTKVSAKERSSRTEQFKNVVTLLGASTDKNLSVADIASLSGMSEAALKKLFSEYAGMGVIHYFNLLKIRAAQAMLQDGKTVREVSELLDFTNQNYFSTVFKRLTGKSPSFYKK